METKPWYKSRTVWVNVATIAALTQLILSFFGYTPDESTVNRFSELLVMLSPVLNLILRMDTTKGLRWGS